VDVEAEPVESAPMICIGKLGSLWRRFGQVFALAWASVLE
jgi:hypothetical protein